MSLLNQSHKDVNRDLFDVAWQHSKSRLDVAQSISGGIVKKCECSLQDRFTNLWWKKFVDSVLLGVVGLNNTSQNNLW